MGIYDRDYYREDEPRGLFGDQTAVLTLILVTVAIYLIQVFATDQVGGWIDEHFSASVDTLWQPWLWWRFITYGFLHDRGSFTHVLFNMIALFFFGRDVEGIYGRKPFLWLYLTALIVSGIGWALVELATSGNRPAELIGASGAVTAVLLIFCLHFPQRQVLLMFIPVPAWLLAVIMIGGDFLYALRPEVQAQTNVAYVAHLAGAAYGYAFYRTQWSLYWLAPTQLGATWRRWTRPKLRVHQADRAPPRTEGNLQSRVDDILEKISRSGQDSLTDEERLILENASRHYQQRRK